MENILYARLSAHTYVFIGDEIASLKIAHLWFPVCMWKNSNTLIISTYHK